MTQGVEEDVPLAGSVLVDGLVDALSSALIHHLIWLTGLFSDCVLVWSGLHSVHSEAAQCQWQRSKVRCGSRKFAKVYSYISSFVMPIKSDLPRGEGG